MPADAAPHAAAIARNVKADPPWRTAWRGFTENRAALAGPVISTAP